MESKTKTHPLTKIALLFLVLLVCIAPLLIQTSSTLAFGSPLGESGSPLKGSLHFPLDLTKSGPWGLTLDGVANSGLGPINQVGFSLATSGSNLKITTATLDISRLESFSWSGYYWEASWVNTETGELFHGEPQFIQPLSTASHQSYPLPLPTLSPTEAFVQLDITPAQEDGASWGQLEAGNRWALHLQLEENPQKTFSSPTLGVEGYLYFENPQQQLDKICYLMDFRAAPLPLAPTTLYFDPHGGVGSHPALTAQVGDVLSPPPLASFTKQGYFFTHWSVDPEGLQAFDFTAPLPVSPPSIRLYAQWSLENPLGIAIKFNQDWGSYTPIQYIKVGALISRPPDPERKGHHFKSWTQDLEGLIPWDFDLDTVPAGVKELLLHPQWTLDPEAKFYVRFEANDGSPTPSTLLLSPGSTLPQIHTPTKYYNEFTGWYKDHTLSASWIPFSDVTPPRDIYLYAGWRLKESGSSLSDPDPNLPQWENGAWGAAEELMDQHKVDRESWILYEKNLLKPLESNTAQDHIVLMMKENFKMPRSVLDLLSTQKGRKLQVNVGKGYQWHFSADSPWRELDYKDYNLQAEDSHHPAIARLVGDHPAHQFRIHHLGSWPTRPYLSIQLGDNLKSKNLHLYSYNPYTNRLEYVSPVATLQDGWFLMPLPPSGGSAVGEYVVTPTLFKDAVVLPTNPETGGQPVSMLLSYGRLLPSKDTLVDEQSTPLTVTSHQIGLFMLAFLTVINGVVLINIQRKRRKI